MASPQDKMFVESLRESKRSKKQEEKTEEREREGKRDGAVNIRTPRGTLLLGNYCWRTFLGNVSRPNALV